MAKKRASGKKKNEDQDILNYLKQAGKEAQRNVTDMQKVFRAGPAPEVGYWSESELDEMNRYYKNERRAQSQSTRLANAQRDVMSGRTVEPGTRSMLEGLKGWIRGGGGSRLTGR